MKSISFYDDCTVESRPLTMEVEGEAICSYRGKDGYFYVLKKTDNYLNSDSAVVFNLDEVVHHVETDRHYFVYQQYPSGKDSRFISCDIDEFFSRNSEYFLNDSKNYFSYLVTRLKSKKVGKATLLDIENVKLSVVDYYRFIDRATAIGKSRARVMGLMAEMIFDATNTISNLQGGISVLGGGSVESHLQFGFWLKAMEKEYVVS